MGNVRALARLHCSLTRVCPSAFISIQPIKWGSRPRGCDPLARALLVLLIDLNVGRRWRLVSACARGNALKQFGYFARSVETSLTIGAWQQSLLMARSNSVSALGSVDLMPVITI